MSSVVCVRNRHRSRVAENLGIIELHAAGSECVQRVCPIEYPDLDHTLPVPRRKIARVLVQHAGKNRFRHVVADVKIRVRSSEVAPLSRRALSERAVRVRQLSLASKSRSQDYGSAVEGILTGDDKFLSDRNRLVVR